MYRILYQNSAGEYEILNAETPEYMEKSAFDIAYTNNIIICIYDYQHKKTLFKCPQYDSYLNTVNELVYENKKSA
jgi:hypothetical protein